MLIELRTTLHSTAMTSKRYSPATHNIFDSKLTLHTKEYSWRNEIISGVRDTETDVPPGISQGRH
ncbi:MAG: hypothetical protein ACRDCT_03670, partial [Shewanella sp.]